MSLLCTYTYNSSNLPQNQTTRCSEHFSDIKFIEFSYNNNYTINAQFALGNANWTISSNSYNNYYLFGVDSTNYAHFSSFNATSAPSDWELVVSFYDSMPGAATGSINISENGTFDVSNYSTAVVSVPQTTVVSDITPYSNLVVDSFWQYHTAFAGSVVALIAIFLVYRLLKGRLR